MLAHWQSSTTTPHLTFSTTPPPAVTQPPHWCWQQGFEEQIFHRCVGTRYQTALLCRSLVHALARYKTALDASNSRQISRLPVSAESVAEGNKILLRNVHKILCLFSYKIMLKGTGVSLKTVVLVIWKNNISNKKYTNYINQEHKNHCSSQIC